MQRYTKISFFTLLAEAPSLGTFPYSINVLPTKRCWFSVTLVWSPDVYSPWLVLMKNDTELLLETPSMCQSRDLLIHVLYIYYFSSHLKMNDVSNLIFQIFAFRSPTSIDSPLFESQLKIDREKKIRCDKWIKQWSWYWCQVIVTWSLRHDLQS